MHLVPNAYEPRPALPRAEARRRLGIGGDEGFRVGWIGRVTHEKGLDLAVRALAHPAAGGSVLSVVGDGAERERVRALADSLGVSGRISWHGMVPDAGALVGAFDALLLSSRTEGTPIVLFEAMAAGTPIIATRVGGVPDVVRPSEAALVPPEDPGAIAGVVQTLRLDGAAAAQRAVAARARLVGEFAVEPWLDRYERVYAAAMANRRGTT
jgi:glycosyltransferase involved in cell wall biosynthesis